MYCFRMEGPAMHMFVLLIAFISVKFCIQSIRNGGQAANTVSMIGMGRHRFDLLQTANQRQVKLPWALVPTVSFFLLTLCSERKGHVTKPSINEKEKMFRYVKLSGS